MREGLQLGAEPGPGRLHRQRHRGDGQQLAAADQLLAPVERVAVEPQAVAVVQDPDDLGADPVQHRDAGLDEQLGAEVGVAAADARGGVDDSRDAGVDEQPGAAAVQVEVLEHGDVTGAGPAGQRGRPSLDPGRAVQAGQRGLMAGPAQGGKTHDPDAVM